MTHRNRRQRGNALLATTLVLAVLFSLSLVVGQDVINNSRTTARSIGRKQAYYVAQSGVQLALAELNQHLTDPAWANAPRRLTGTLPGSPDLPYKVTLENNQDGHLASIPRGAIQIDAQVAAPNGGPAEPVRILSTATQFNPTFNQAVLATNISLADHAVVYGAVVSSDNITVEGQAQIQGDLSYREGVRGSDGKWVTPPGLESGQIGGTHQNLQSGTDYTGKRFASAATTTVSLPAPADIPIPAVLPNRSDFPDVVPTEMRPTESPVQLYQWPGTPGLGDGKTYGWLTKDEAQHQEGARQTAPGYSNMKDDPGLWYKSSAGDKLFLGGISASDKISKALGESEYEVLSDTTGKYLGPIIDGVAYLPSEYDHQVPLPPVPPTLDTGTAYGNITLPAGQRLRLPSGKYYIAGDFEVHGQLIVDPGVTLYVGHSLTIDPSGPSKGTYPAGQVNQAGSAGDFRVYLTDQQDTKQSQFRMANGATANAMVAGSGLRASLESGAQMTGSLVAHTLAMSGGARVSAAAAGPNPKSLLYSRWRIQAEKAP